jgi:hypothetical protein
MRWRVFIFCAGHGYYDSESNQGYLAAADVPDATLVGRCSGDNQCPVLGDR